ncbi:uncharacterized protein LOC144051037 isoform X1 [Vanacampus margaritifer]
MIPNTRLNFVKQNKRQRQRCCRKASSCVTAATYTMDDGDGIKICFTEPPCVKEEEEQHCISQEGEQLQGLDFPVIHVIVKGEDDEDKSPSEHSRGTEPQSSSSSQYITAEGDGDHCRESTADSDDTTSNYPDTDEDHSKGNVNKPLKCSQCNKTFSHKKNLKRHMRYHTGEKPFVCSFCGQAFYEKAHLTTHTRTHTGEKPFSCSICDKIFCDRSAWVVHQRTHTGEKPFACSTCGKSFPRRENLRTHTRTHTGEKPFTCAVCKTSFTVRSTLVQHMRTHTGEKPFACSDCGTRFSQKTHLKNHMRRHTGEKPFTCPFCDKRFSVKGSLITHIRTHTGGM